MTLALADLEAAGLMVNLRKSVLAPTQQLNHLGFSIDLQQGKLLVPPAKLKALRKELGKLVTKSEMSCRKMASILGSLRSFLKAIPSLRAFTDEMLAFTHQAQTLGWNVALAIPQSLKQQVREVEVFLHQWPGRVFDSPTQTTLHSDSSDLGWGGHKCAHRAVGPGLLEGKKRVAHKHKRVGSGNFHSQKFGKKRGTPSPWGG